MELTLTIGIIVITSGVSLYAMNQRQVLNKLMMNPYMVTNRGQYYRTITSGFIHADHIHLLFNMISFYFFGTGLESIFQMIFGSLGGVYFVLMYLLAIVVSDIPTLIKHRNNPGYNSLGASGAVSAVIFACILFDPLLEIYFLPGFIMGTAYLIYSSVSSRRSRDGINHDAHLYGALFGIIFCLVLYPASFQIFLARLSEWKFFNL
jgi:membrane associated rhomboid family serine protease